MAKIFYKCLIIVCVVEFIKCISINYDTYCPSGYEQVPDTTICALITTSKAPFTNLCLNIGQHDPQAYNDLMNSNESISLIMFLKQRRLKSVWLPIQKNEQNILAWKLPMPTWNRRVDTINSMNTLNNYHEGDCVLFMVDDEELMVENCGTVHHQLCLFNQGDTHYVITNLCETATATSRFSKFHGFCFELEYFNNTLRNDNTSKIAFIESEDKLVAVDQYILFSDVAPYEKTQIATNFFSNIPPGYVTVLTNSRIEFVERQEVSARVIEKNIDTTIRNYRVTIHIMHDPVQQVLIVNIRNYKFLWTIDIREYSPVKCYTDVDLNADILDQIYPNSTEIGPNFHMTIDLWQIKGIGNYWCEGQKLLTFETITSNRLTIIHEESQTFCVYAEKRCGSCNVYREIENIESFDTDKNFFNHSMKLTFKKLFTSHNDIMTVLIHGVEKNSSGPVNEAKNLRNVRSRIETVLSEFNYDIKEIRVADTCLSQDLTYFANAQLNTISVFKIFCLLDTGLPPIQKCIGNQFDGAYWEREYNTTAILDNCDQNRITEESKELFMLNQELRLLNETKEHTKNIIERTLAVVTTVINGAIENSSDVQYAAITLNNLIASTNLDIFDVMKDGNTSTILDPVTQIIDNLLEQETHPLVEDPNKILATIDVLALKYAESVVTDKVFLESDDGVVLIKKSNIILMIVNPAIKQISGIALYKTKNNIHNLNDYSVRKLQGHEKAVHIYNKSLELSIQIPTESLSKIQIDQDGYMMPPKRIIFKIYYKNSLFDETKIDPEKGVVSETIDTDSKIVSISVSNYTGFEATHGLFAMFRTQLHVRRSKPIFLGCSDFSTVPGSTVKGWNRDFTKYENLDDNIVVCPVNRLSNIGFVKLFGNKIVTDHTTKILIAISHYTTITGCVLSIIGLVIIFLTAIFFEKWYRREATPLVLNVSVATFLQIIMFTVAESQIFTNSVNCLIVGGILHYFTLVALFISLFVADCQYRRYVLVFGPAVTDKFKTKLFIVGWLVPFIMVAGCILVQPNSYIPSEEFHDLGGICYPTNFILHCFVHAPIIIIFCINSSVYIWIIVRLTREDPRLRKTPRKSIVVAQIRLFLFMFMVLSLTWIFGLLAHYTELYAFSFLFNLLAPMQGFCLFVFCCLVDAQTRNFWLKGKICKN